VMTEYKKWGGPMLKVAGSGKKCQPADLVVK
jgi:hypothetical protein